MKPGAKGTLALAEQFGENLVCVRYRYDEAGKKRFTTAEIIVSEGDWERDVTQPEPARHTELEQPEWLRIGLGEQELQQRVRQAGGRWDRARRLWQLPPGKTRELGLEARLVKPVPGV